MPRILSFGIATEYLEKRAHLLVNGGFKVSSASQKDEAIRLAKANAPDIVIFGHKVPATLRASLSATMKKINPAVRLIYIYAGTREGLESADAVLNIETEPSTLIETIQYLDQASAPPAEPLGA